MRKIHKDIYDISAFMPYFGYNKEYLHNELELINNNQVIQILERKLNEFVIYDLDILVNRTNKLLYSTEYLDNMYDIKNILMN